MARIHGRCVPCPLTMVTLKFAASAGVAVAKTAPNAATLAAVAMRDMLDPLWTWTPESTLWADHLVRRFAIWRAVDHQHLRRPLARHGEDMHLVRREIARVPRPELAALALHFRERRAFEQVAH